MVNKISTRQPLGEYGRNPWIDNLENRKHGRGRGGHKHISKLISRELGLPKKIAIKWGKTSGTRNTQGCANCVCISIKLRVKPKALLQNWREGCWVSWIHRVPLFWNNPEAKASGLTPGAGAPLPEDGALRVGVIGLLGLGVIHPRPRVCWGGDII